MTGVSAPELCGPGSEGSSLATQRLPRSISFTGNQRGPNCAHCVDEGVRSPGDGKAPAAPGAREQLGSSPSMKIQVAVPESCCHPEDVGRWAQGGQCCCGAVPSRPGPPCPFPHCTGAPARPLCAEVPVVARTGAADRVLLSRSGGQRCRWATQAARALCGGGGPLPLLVAPGHLGVCCLVAASLPCPVPSACLLFNSMAPASILLQGHILWYGGQDSNMQHL